MKETSIDSITLAPIQERFFEELTRLANNRNIADNLRDGFPHPYNLSDAIEFAEKALNDPLLYKRAILVNKNFVGLVGLSREKENPTIAEIGYWIGEEYWGKGYASKAITTMIENGFQELDLSKIYAKVIEDNLGSIKALERSGFVYKGIIDEVCNSIQKDSPTLLYEINPSDV